jgi:tetratricopeptide (TPR) repeat protein
MKRWLGSILGISILTGSVTACYNDYDTYLTELRDNLDITNAIIGRFTLYPPEYYRRRIEIQTAILKKDPNNLEAYDNISVAFDRVGDGESALKWIHEKRKHLANAPSLQLYSTEANEGTFLIVRWIRGHKAGDTKDAIEAEKHIAKALQINPNAHFGREFAQLYCIRAMIQSGKAKDWMPVFTQNLIFIADRDHIDRKKLRYGIAGMMVLGAAWNSPVFIQAIAELVPQEGQVADLCRNKLRFLTHDDEVYRSEHDGQDLVKAFPIKAGRVVHGGDTSKIRELLKNGYLFRETQAQWVEDQVAKGLHPDKGDDIWRGYQEVPPIPKEQLTNSTFLSRTGTFLVFVAMQTLGCGCIVPIVIVYAIIRKIIVTVVRRRKGY